MAGHGQRFSTGGTQTRFASTISRLLNGATPKELAPNQSETDFYKALFSLDADKVFLQTTFKGIQKEILVGKLKKPLNGLFANGLALARDTTLPELTVSHLLDTLCLLFKYVLEKNLSGWEVMEVFAGGVSHSDAFFMGFVDLFADSLNDDSRPSAVRHQTLQLGLVFMCGISQLSPGAYFLRRDVFHALATFIKSHDTQQFTFEALLFLAILCDFHKVDAARSNLYLVHVKDSDDQELMKNICWAANFALQTSVKTYQDISDDEPTQSFGSSFGQFLSSMRPDKALSSVPAKQPKEMFKNQPIEATVILLPIYEFIYSNSLFVSETLKSLSDPDTQSHLLLTILSLSSYVLTHASSTSQPRSLAYANLALHTLLTFAENDAVLTVFCRPCKQYIRLCRQREPDLPTPVRTGRAPICALLDCCILWLRHNLHLKLEVQMYTTCIYVLHRTIYYLIKVHERLVYHWRELWAGLLGLLHFLATKLNTLVGTGGIESLVVETINLLNLCLSKADVFLPAPKDVHEFAYELVRSSSDIQSQAPILKQLEMPRASNKRNSLKNQPADVLMKLVSFTQFYQMKITEAKAKTAGSALRVIAAEIEANGLHGIGESMEPEPLANRESMLGFSRYACMDGLALMP
ncbi:hypothetical protein CYLTODRAFT_237652 [Cylindrobasidium torrendii FP15055 ss-10]|uniref:Armadillo-like helical domain-containing protein n=1 Tax=Cylindrobasidium torrendii FP15055 ss-10 TaxID=1314674 RepID=A0A0D7BHR8_9AGAR|nr:hypothetical protein CYLTODRAFT_237652 [Cylindrobasidium torrendii FP15055 ss-10]